MSFKAGEFIRSTRHLYNKDEISRGINKALVLGSKSYPNIMKVEILEHENPKFNGLKVEIEGWRDWFEVIDLNKQVTLSTTKGQRKEHLIGEITEVLDEYLKADASVLKSLKTSFGYATYLNPPDKVITNEYGIRFVGSTVGSIHIDNNQVITKFEFYEDTPVYSEEVKEAVTRFIGTSIIIK